MLSLCMFYSDVATTFASFGINFVFRCGFFLCTSRFCVYVGLWGFGGSRMVALGFSLWVFDILCLDFWVGWGGGRLRPLECKAVGMLFL